jgi:cytochrome P450
VAVVYGVCGLFLIAGYGEEFETQHPFREARESHGGMRCPFQGGNLPLILRHADVKTTAKDWNTFGSDAPFRVPIPSDEKVRNVRQLPIVTNPPKHTEFRNIVEPYFKRPRDVEC